MPDPVDYLKALLAAAVASAMIVLALRFVLRRSVDAIAEVVGVLAVSAGLLTGYGVLQFSWVWPPASALSRFLTIVLPTIVSVELLAAAVSAKGQGFRSGCGPDFPEILRFGVCASVGRILLHGSVYLAGPGKGNTDAWTSSQTIAVLCGSMAVLITAWTSLCRLSQRSAPGSISLSLVMAILCAGISTMLAGYIKGGAAAIPLAAALAGTTLASSLLSCCAHQSDARPFCGMIGIGLIGLFSLLCIGRFFGQLSSPTAIVIFLSPLLCWISEIPKLRPNAPWQIGAIRLIAVAIPLAAVLVIAKRDFDQKMAPLLAAPSEMDDGIMITSLECIPSVGCITSLGCIPSVESRLQSPSP